MLALGACAASSANVTGEGAKGSGERASEFDAVFAQNMAAAERHFWHEFDCKNRSEVTGMPTSTIALPGAVDSFIDTTDYQATHVFRGEEGAQEGGFAFERARFKANTPEGFEHHKSERGDYEQLSHKARSEDFATVSLRVEDAALFITFHSRASSEIPHGNPCLKADFALLSARFDAMKEGVVSSDEALFKSQWHTEGYEANLVGGSGIPGVGVFRQGSAERWVLEPDLKSARNPTMSGDAWVITCVVRSLADGGHLGTVWIVVADGKVLGGGEVQDEAQALAYRWANKVPLAP
ncbi:MAG: hypothetical protein ACPGU1_19165 [Myxococcota bacterium]